MAGISLGTGKKTERKWVNGSGHRDGAENRE